MSTTPGSPSSSRFHSRKCLYLLDSDPYLRRDPVAEHDEGVVLEQVRNRVLVVGEIFVIGPLEIAIGRFQLHEDERNAVDETDHIGAATVKHALDPQLAHGEEVIVLRIVEIEDAQAFLLQIAFRVPIFDDDAIAQHLVALAIGEQQRLRDGRFGDFAYGGW